MRLFIAEKPSLARAIAAVLPSPQKAEKGCIRCGSSDVVAWCAGHVLELAEMEDYDPAFAERWSMTMLDRLPFVPKEWKLKPTERGAELVKGIKQLLREAKIVVNAGDADREGQLLVDELLEFLGFSGRVERIHVTDMNPDAVKKALAALKPNEQFRPLYHAGLGRQRADWAFGMSYTRVMTILGQEGGTEGVLSVGRVQTPVLALVVRRDLEIEGFRPRDFFDVVLKAKAGAEFRARWRPGDAVPVASRDEEGRVLDRGAAEAVGARVRGRPGRVVEAADEEKQTAPPLPFSLASLQVEAARRLGLSASETLGIVQALYETHKVLTYPRSDCEYLPEGHLAEVPEVLTAIVGTSPNLGSAVAGAETSRRSGAWNDAKVTAHHAIIPTKAPRAPESLSEQERAVYELVARRYLMQLYAPIRFRQVTLELEVEGERFAASGRAVIEPGWKALAGAEPQGDEEQTPEAEAPVPALAVGASVDVLEAQVEAKQTKPPKRFTDASIIQAMVNIAKFVTDPKTRQVLKETDGIGTPATRADIVEKLVARGFLERSGKGKTKQLVSTDKARGFIAVLPPEAVTPELTAKWEAALRQVQEGTLPLEKFMSATESKLRTLVQQARERGPFSVGEVRDCPKGCGGKMGRRTSKKGPFWSCRKCRHIEDATSAGADRARPGGRGTRRAAGGKGRREGRR